MSLTDRPLSETAQDVTESIVHSGIRPGGPVAVLTSGRLVSVADSVGSTRITYEGLAVNRWRPESGSESYSVWIRDIDTGKFWSATPEIGSSADDEVLFDVGRVAYRRTRNGIRSTIDVFVSEDDDAEIRRLVVRNDTDRPRRLDVTSYLEIALNSPEADLGHPAFSKLFVQTAFDAERDMIRAWRRLRSPDEQSITLAHFMAGDGSFAGFDSSRPDFIGRGRSVMHPAGMDASQQLGGSSGSVLDPAAILRRTIDLEPGEEAQMLLVVAVARQEDSLYATVDRLAAPAFDVAGEMRAAGAREVERLLMHQIDAGRLRYFRRLTGALFVPEPHLRAPKEIVSRVTAPLARLSQYDLHPRRPIAVVRVAGEEDLPLVRTLLKAHQYWTDLGLSVDVVVLNDKSETEAAEELQLLIEQAARQFDEALHVRGGVQTIYSDDIPPEDQVLIQSCAAILIREAFPEVDQPRQAPSHDAEPVARPATRAAAPPPRTRPDLLFDNGYGGFTEDGREYAIIIDADMNGRHRLPPQPWTNVIANERLGFIVSETGAGCTWSGNSRENRLTAWSNDPVVDPHGEAYYVRDEEEGWFWSPMPGPAPAPASYHVYHGAGYSRFESEFGGLMQTTHQFVHRDAPLKVTRVRLQNRSTASRTLSLFGVVDLAIGSEAAVAHRLTQVAWDRRLNAVVARNRAGGEFADQVVFVAAGTSAGEVSHSTDVRRFVGGGSLARPQALEHVHRISDEGAGSGALLQVRLELPPGEEATVDFLLGSASGDREARSILNEYRRPASALEDAQRFWDDLVNGLQIATPSAAIDLMVNRWLPYQNLGCRMRGRSAFYQSGGAFGYRDQLQDAAAMLHLDPSITRRQIVLHAAHQFAEGDVLHWWHPPTGKGIRTRFSDDLLWLPYAASYYTASTGDATLLDESAEFLTARQLEPGEDEAFVHPEPSGEAGSVYEHCCRALDRSLTRGAHGLPLMGTGDWNDGMNRVGRDGKGESVWLGFFLYHILEQFVPICRTRGDLERAGRYEAFQSELYEALNASGWDGEWYRRAYYDNGDPLGSATNDEARIDALAQAWAVISGAAPPERAALALDAMDRHLVDEEAGIIRLLTPAFDKTQNDPGYIKGYVPGVRENGGQYTHAALWAVQAFAEAGRGDRAARLLEMLSPIAHTRTQEAVERYRVEPYVIAADVYGVEPHVGRGGWTWYTGSAGWMYRVAVESILGLRVEQGRTIVLSPSIPAGWPEFSIRYRVPVASTTYQIHVRNADGRTRGVRSVIVDGSTAEVVDETARIPIRREAGVIVVEVEM